MTLAFVPTMQRKTYRILVLDTSASLATGLAALLDGSEGLCAAGLAVTPRLDRLTAGPNAPDLMLVDVGEMALSPQDLLRRLHAVYGPAMAIVGYVAKDSLALARTCLSLGFRGFLSKSSSLETVRQCLASVRAGAVFICPRHAEALQASQEIQPPVLGLTEREAYVLKSVARGKSLKEIGYELALSCKTVETYKARGTSKLNISGRREIVEFAIRAGWV